MKSPTYRLRPIGNGSNPHSFYFVNDDEWLAAINDPLKRLKLQTVKVDFINKHINPPELVMHAFPLNNTDKFSKSEQKFIKMRVNLNFNSSDIYNLIFKPLSISSLI